MKYSTASAFRRALEDRLRQQSLRSGVPLVRMRKMIAFDRFLARLVQAQPGQWVVKGGLALQLRMGQRARTTKDIDLLMLDQQREVYPRLREAGMLVLDDWFSFEVSHPALSATEDFGGDRYQLLSLLDGRRFEGFHLDVGIGDSLVEPVDYLQTPSLLAFAGFSPTRVPCYPITQQIAEKLHACTRTFQTGGSSRVKDYVDILLLASMGPIEGKRLREAMTATFAVRQTHPLPVEMPKPPSGWERPFQRLAVEVQLEQRSILEGSVALQHFLNPALNDNPIGLWDPISWRWQ